MDVLQSESDSSKETLDIEGLCSLLEIIEDFHGNTWGMHCILSPRHIGQRFYLLRSFAFPKPAWCPLISKASSFHWHSYIIVAAKITVPRRCTPGTGLDSSCRALSCFSRLLSPAESLWQECIPRPKEVNNEINPSFCFAVVAVAGINLVESQRIAELWNEELLFFPASWPYYWQSTTFQCSAVGISTTGAWLLVRKMRVWALWTAAWLSLCFICLLLLYFLKVEQPLPADWPWNGMKSWKLA